MFFRPFLIERATNVDSKFLVFGEAPEKEFVVPKLGYNTMLYIY